MLRLHVCACTVAHVSGPTTLIHCIYTHGKSANKLYTYIHVQTCRCISWSFWYMLYKWHTHQMNTDQWLPMQTRMHTLGTNGRHCLCYIHTHILYMHSLYITQQWRALFMTAQSCRGRTRAVSSLTLSAFGLSFRTLPLPFTRGHNTCNRFEDGVM